MYMHKPRNDLLDLSISNQARGREEVDWFHDVTTFVHHYVHVQTHIYIWDHVYNNT